MASHTLRTGSPASIASTARPPAERGEDVVAGHALGTHRAELTVEPGPELLQAHAPTLTRPAPLTRPHRPRLGSMIPGTGSGALGRRPPDRASPLALLVTIVLLIRNYRGR